MLCFFQKQAPITQKGKLLSTINDFYRWYKKRQGFDEPVKKSRLEKKERLGEKVLHNSNISVF